MSVGLNVLIVEDSEDDTMLLVRQLRQADYDLTYERVESPAELSAALERQQWDMVISDYSLPRFSGLDALQIVKQKQPGLPFVIVSGTIGEDTAVAAMRAGAQDYIMKSNLKRLAPAVERELSEAQVRRARVQAEEDLRRSDERFRLTVEGVRDYGIFMLDPEGHIINWNIGAERIFGYRASEIIGKPMAGLYPNGHADERVLQIAVRDGRFEEEGWRRRKDGSQFWADVIVTALHEEQDRLRGFVVVARDITERMQAQEEIKRQVERLGALRAIEMAISSSLDLRITLNIILDQVTTQLQVDAADILLLDQSSQTLSYAASRGFRSTEVGRTHIPIRQGFAGRAVLTRQMVSVPNLADADPAFLRAPLLAREGFVAYYAAPLIAKGAVKGVLEVFHRAPLDPDQNWIEFLDALVGQAAIALDNAALFDDLQRSNLELVLAYNATIEGWSRALDLRDRETEGHTQRVTERALDLARVLGMNDSELVHMRRGALLHDIGKMGIPDRILLKPGGLTQEEWMVMRRHPSYAYEWLSPIQFLAPSLDIPYCHHERWNGAGYPRGLKGEEIPLPARIFAVVDVYDALTSDRPYRMAWPQERVIQYLNSQVGTQFDPRVVKTFVEFITSKADRPTEDGDGDH